MRLRALKEAPLPLSGDWDIDQPPVTAYMEGVRAQLIPIMKFVEEKVPQEDMGKVDELVEMYMLGLCTLFYSNSGTSTSIVFRGSIQ